MRYYVLADVHGFYDAMIKALQKAGYYEDREEKKIVLCGDAFDRGKQAKETQDFLVDLLKKDALIYIRGNHEDLLRDFVDDMESFSWRGVEYTHHYTNGTVGTVAQLTGYTPTKMNYDAARVRTSFRYTDTDKYLFSATVDFFETKNYVFVHGWIPCTAIPCNFGPRLTVYRYREDWRNASPADWERARWYNGMEVWHDGVVEPGKTVVCGHWHASYGHVKFEGKGEEFGVGADYTPFVADGIVALDACTALSGFCNCLVVDDEPVEP